MEISNDSNFASSSGSVLYAATYNGWTLTSGNGTKTVYVRFTDSVGNVGSAISDTIIYDDILPVITISAPSRYAVKNGLTVSYDLTIDDSTATLSGINAGDVSKIKLTGTGTIADKIDSLIVTIENTDTTHRKSQYNYSRRSYRRRNGCNKGACRCRC